MQPYCQSINFIKLPKLRILFGLAMAFFKGLPMQCGYFYNRKAAKKVDALIAKHQPDMLYGQLVRVAEYIRHKDIPKAIDYQDAATSPDSLPVQSTTWNTNASAVMRPPCSTSSM